MKTLLTIGGVEIHHRESDESDISTHYEIVRFTSNLDICNDGCGPSYGDPHYQPKTAYYNSGKYLNADVDKYIVIPPQIRSMVKGVVMGCQARLTNLETNVECPAVVGEIGPKNKTGEASYCLAKIINPSITHNSGDKRRIYLYEFWPGIPAVVGEKTYKLEPARKRKPKS